MVRDLSRAARPVVVGGGWAGLAAAVRLSEAGVPVTVLEANTVLGGRARRVVRDGVALDNGAHILLGAYTGTLGLMAQVLPGALPVRRSPLALEIPGQFSLRCPPWPGALRLAAGILGATGLSWGDKLGVARFMVAQRLAGFRTSPSTTVASLLSAAGQTGRARQYLWDPLCVAALNTDPAVASAQVFLSVLRDALAGAASASDLVLPSCDLSALFPEPAATFVRARGGEVRCGVRVSAIAADGAGFTLECGGERVGATHVIWATDPWRARRALAPLPALNDTVQAIARLTYEPITTVYLRYAGGATLPSAMCGHTDGPAQWFFDRGILCGHVGWIAGVVSCAAPWRGVPTGTLAAQVHAQAAQLVPGLRSPDAQFVITEKRATFACVPGMVRPVQRTGLPRLYLAGDYTHGPYPATLEAATRSGTLCARAVLEDIA